MSGEVDVHRFAGVRVLGHRSEPDIAILQLDTRDGGSHFYDMTAPELTAMAMRLLSAARLLGAPIGWRQ